MAEEECECRDICGGDHLGRYINHLSKLIRYTGNAYLAKKGFSVTGTQVRVLGFIRFGSEGGKCVYQRDIESEFKIKRSSVASILANLEKDGYIERIVDDCDARTKKVMLTEKGRQINKAMTENIQRMEDAVSADMTPQERQMFISLIKRAINNVETSGLLCAQEDPEKQIQKNNGL